MSRQGRTVRLSALTTLRVPDGAAQCPTHQFMKLLCLTCARDLMQTDRGWIRMTHDHASQQEPHSQRRRSRLDPQGQMSLLWNDQGAVQIAKPAGLRMAHQKPKAVALDE
jgi:hypothetical protein